MELIYLHSEMSTMDLQPRRFNPVAFFQIQRLFQWSNPFRTLNYHGRRQPALLVIWTILFIGYLPTAMQAEKQQDCATCARERSLSILKEEEVRQWRIESTKQQILDRLEMEDRPPRVKTKEAYQQLPPAVNWHQQEEEQEQQSSYFQDQDETEPARHIILYPVRIFRNRNTSNTKQSHDYRSETLKFHITDEMIEAVLQSAVLWMAEENASSQVIWHSVDVSDTVDWQIDNNQNVKHRRNRLLSLPLDTRISSSLERSNAHPRPYLIVQLDPSSKRSAEGVRLRRKRNTTPMCGSTVSQCCRESLFVSFKDVGWDDWIIAPSGFHAFYCRGSCRTFSSAANSATSHASLLQKLILRDRVPNEARPHLTPCCAPTRLSPLTIFYSDAPDVIKQRNLPNMIVESCGCAL